MNFRAATWGIGNELMTEQKLGLRRNKSEALLLEWFVPREAQVLPDAAVAKRDDALVESGVFCDNNVASEQEEKITLVACPAGVAEVDTRPRPAFHLLSHLIRECWES